jgi:hypothetical protein
MSDAFRALAAASLDWIGDTPTGAMLSAMRAFVSAAAKDESVVREAAASLSAQEPGAVAFIAVAFGALVERGASAEVTGPAVLDVLRAWLPELPVPAAGDASVPVPTPDQAMRLARFQFLCQSAVTHLARLPALRDALGREGPLLERLDGLRSVSYGAWWVHEALLKSSGTIVLLHPPSGTGLRLRYMNVSRCFHLFTLLQTAVGTRIPGGREPDETIAAVARGKSGESVTDDTWWHYGKATSPKSDSNASVLGEGNVREIPRVDGEQVMLLWPKLMAHEWDAGSLGPHLEAMPADAAVERMLTPDESRVWLEKVGVAPQRKRWWRF